MRTVAYLPFVPSRELAERSMHERIKKPIYSVDMFLYLR